MIVATVLTLVLVAGYLAQLLRWLRVLQREHYLGSSLARFAVRWALTPRGSFGGPFRRLRKLPLTDYLAAPVIVVILFTTVAPGWGALLSGLGGFVTPVGLSIRGRTSALAWTRRLRYVATVTVLFSLVVVVIGLVTGWPWVGGAVAVFAVPFTMALANISLAPYEEREARRFVDRASRRLAKVAPLTVAITGSFGKTSTKHHLFSLLEGRGAYATPRSFNNRAGLSRSINEGLSDDVRIFIAEMGTYGPGEIEALCAWCPPDIAVVTAIGPVHLERMGSLDTIERAKFEITQLARVVVLNVDDPRLASWVDRLRKDGKRVVRAGSLSSNVDVRVERAGGSWILTLPDAPPHSLEIPAQLHPTNVACAIATARECGVTDEDIYALLEELRAVESRMVVSSSTRGVQVIDDTFNANPSSARSALDLLSTLEVTGRRVLVTPGLIELGSTQYDENFQLARETRHRGIELIVVGRTNAPALAAGFGESARRVSGRDAAVAWVKETLGLHDAVLYLNDLPDHYP